MNHRILVPTDFSDVCNNALNHGAEIAKRLNCKLLILHVINKNTKANLLKVKIGVGNIQRELQNLAKGIQNEHGIEAEVLSRHGSIFNIIRQVGHEQGVSIMVMGTHGKNGLQHLVGSAAIKVISGMEIPVIVVQNRIFGDGFKKIILPLSLEIDFLDKLDWAVEIAAIFNSEILIFNMKWPDGKLQNTMDKIQRLIESKLHIENISYCVYTAPQVQPFSRGLLEFAIINRADMMVVTMEKNKLDSSHQTRIEEEMLIYNTSQIPVMCINPS